METRELLILAWRSILVNKLRSFLTILGIIIGVFAIILLVSIGSGLQQYITGQITGLGSNLIFVIPGRIGGARTPGGVTSNKLLISDATNLQNKLKDFANVAPIVQQSVTIKYQNKSDKNTSAVGTTANYPQTLQNITIVSGNFFSASQERLGAKVAIVGQTVVNNLFTDNKPLQKIISISNNRYLIIGVLNKRGSTFGVDQDNVVIVPLLAAQQQFGLNNVNTIFIEAKAANLVDFVKQRAEKILLQRLTNDDFSLETSASTLSIVGNITGVLTLTLGAIAAISLLVGGIGVANIMLVSVTERTREIGLRKALGAKRSDILKQFLIEAAILSISGGTIGIILGIGSSLFIAHFFVSVITPWSVILAFSFSLLIGIVFGIAPAIKASKLSPINALRYE